MPAGKLRWCYANANRCCRWALETTNHEHRQAFWDMAHKWSAIALKEERRSVQAGSSSSSTWLKKATSAPDQRRSAGLSEKNVSVEAV